MREALLMIINCFVHRKNVIERQTLFGSSNLSIGNPQLVPAHTTLTSCTSQNTTTPMNEATHDFSFGNGCVIRKLAVVECAASYRLHTVQL